MPSFQSSHGTGNEFTSDTSVNFGLYKFLPDRCCRTDCRLPDRPALFPSVRRHFWPSCDAESSVRRVIRHRVLLPAKMSYPWIASEEKKKALDIAGGILHERRQNSQEAREKHGYEVCLSISPDVVCCRSYLVLQAHATSFF